MVHLLYPSVERTTDTPRVPHCTPLWEKRLVPLLYPSDTDTPTVPLCEGNDCHPYCAPTVSLCVGMADIPTVPLLWRERQEPLLYPYCIPLWRERLTTVLYPSAEERLILCPYFTPLRRNDWYPSTDTPNVPLCGENDWYPYCTPLWRERLVPLLYPSVEEWLIPLLTVPLCGGTTDTPTVPISGDGD